MTERPLHGLNIMVTRPSHQAARLCELIRSAGGTPVALPVIAIEAPQNPAAADKRVAQLSEFDIAVFVSTNAVEKGMALIQQHGGLPPRLQIAAVGQRTAEALSRHGGRIDIAAPPPYNSEALLSHPALQAMADKRIAIFRGEGGRELLGNTLTERGASVSYVEVYRRAATTLDLAETLRQTGDIAILVVTSGEGLRNLVSLAKQARLSDWLLSRRLAVISTRLAQLSKELGFTQPALVAAQATDEAILQAIMTWRQETKTAQ